MRTVLVTGATGFLGHAVVIQLLKNEGFEVVAIGGRPEDKVNTLPKHSRMKQYVLGDLFSESFENIDTVINCAFARSNDEALLSQALDFTEKLIRRLEEIKVKSVINISSQGVYQRLPIGELSTEQSPIAPIDLYSMAKYATEKLFNVSSILHVTNVRLASLMMSQRFLYFFVKKAINNEEFTVTAPKQYASLLDVTDAASGLTALAKIVPEERSSVYNIGIGTQYSLLDYAESVRRIGRELCYDVKYDVSDSGLLIGAGMDCSKMIKETGWRPLVLKDEMIRNCFYLISHEKFS